MKTTMFLAVFLVLSLMTVLLFAVILRCIDQLHEVVRASFLKHLEAYDAQIDEKSAKLQALQVELQAEQPQNEVPQAAIVEDVVVIDVQKDYIDPSFNSDYLLVKQEFQDYAYQAMRNKVMELIRDRKNVNVHELKELQSLFTYEHYYEMLLLNSEEQVEVMQAIVQNSAGKKRILRKYMEQVGSFDFKEFMDYVQDYIFSHDTLIYVYSHDGHRAIEDSPKHVLYRKDLTITEGYKVKYKDTIYDFSL